MKLPNDQQQQHDETMSNLLVVHPEDEHYATPFYFFLLCQVISCNFTEVDRFGKRMGLSPGFPGLACRHCVEDGNGAGRFFPSSIKTWHDGSKTLNSLYHHMMQCRQCPLEIKEKLTNIRKSHDADRMKMKVGSQKAFLTHIWNRLHHTTNNDGREFVSKRKRSSKEEEESDEDTVTVSSTPEESTRPFFQGNRNQTQHLEYSLFCKGSRIQYENKHHDGGMSNCGDISLPSSAKFTCSTSVKSKSYQLLERPIPLATESDKEWLTPLHCFIRLKCVVLFTAKQQDTAPRYHGRRKPVQLGQVGIRCPYCHHEDDATQSTSQASSSEAAERKNVYFPQSVGFIHAATMNLLQRHFLKCSSVPPSVVQQYKTLKADSARSGTSKRCWVESALNLGLVDTEHGIRYCGSPQKPHDFSSTEPSRLCKKPHDFSSTEPSRLCKRRNVQTTELVY